MKPVRGKAVFILVLLAGVAVLAGGAMGVALAQVGPGPSPADAGRQLSEVSKEAGFPVRQPVTFATGANRLLAASVTPSDRRLRIVSISYGPSDAAVRARLDVQQLNTIVSHPGGEPFAVAGRPDLAASRDIQSAVPGEDFASYTFIDRPNGRTTILIFTGQVPADEQKAAAMYLSMK